MQCVSSLVCFMSVNWRIWGMPVFFRADILKIYKQSITVAASKQQALLEVSVIQFQTFTPTHSC